MTAEALALEWSVAKHAAIQHGHLTWWPTAAAGWLLERMGGDKAAALQELGKVRDSAWWDRVEKVLREVD